ncbi:uncharacterized protein Tco025E_07058 [Trypanosoma conorhini]|uniref:FCP1 homology domain-containing protein n=1 Tax=Trypanosoma conorhini TaxID=83891 RepID=A0A3R7KLS6_9TRYP|nr:uncharacterized protein Tco025E_07058 [Trypanosoma conorhini]RNF09000.1 hypothetical protein Tco025E_07058 [Trypanosoma conorhini]
MSHLGRKVPVCVILDIDNTLLSGCRRFSASYPFTAVGGVLASQHSLAYYDAERGRHVRDCILTVRPHLGEFLRCVGRELSTTRVAVQVGVFTRNTPSYAKAIATQVLGPLMPVPLAFAFGSTHCCGPEGRKKPLAVTAFPATSLLVDDSCASFLAEEFFSGRGALVLPFFPGVRPWGAEEELDDVLACGERCAAHDPALHEQDEYAAFLGDGEAETAASLCALIAEFVAFWHNNSAAATGASINLLTDPRAARYQRRWCDYHAPFGKKLESIF